MKVIWIKHWFYNKEQEKARIYNTWFDVPVRDDDIGQQPTIEDGYISLKVDEVLKESEKAIQVNLSTGECDGSMKGWKLWIPKSLIRA